MNVKFEPKQPALARVRKVNKGQHMARANPVEFFQQVRQEVAKVTWPTRQETITTTIMVFIMVLISSIFFLLADQVLSTVVKFVLGLGSSSLF